MRIDWWTLALQTVNVLILVWVLSRFLFRPVKDAIAARQAAAARLLDQARAERDKAQAEAQALAEQTARWGAETTQRQAQAREQIEAEKARLLEQAREQAQSLVRHARAAAESDEARLRQSLEADAVTLARRMTETLLQPLSLPAVTQSLFDDLKARLEGMGATERERLSRDEPLQLAVAAMPDDATRERWLAALSPLLATVPAFLEEPALIAGVELRGNHIRIGRHWRADLDTLQAALRRDPATAEPGHA